MSDVYGTPADSTDDQLDDEAVVNEDLADGGADDYLADNTEPPEDEGVLQPSETLETDELDADPLDTGVSPQERHPASEDYGVTAAEAGTAESLDGRLARELPDVTPPPDPRAGRLVAEEYGDEGASQPLYIGRDVGFDGGGASAEEAAVHEVTDLSDDDEEEDGESAFLFDEDEDSESNTWRTEEWADGGDGRGGGGAGRDR